MHRHLGGWLIGLTLVVAGASCKSPSDGESRSGEPATAETTSKHQNKQQRDDQKPVSSGPFEYTGSIGEKGSEAGQLNQPIGLAVGDAGNLYVSEGGNDRLQKFDPEGTSLAVWAKGLGRPMHIALDSRGRLVVPAYQKDTIHIFDGPKNEVDSFGGDWVDAPAAVEVGPDGRYYVADFYNHRFHILAEDGTVEKTIGEKGKNAGQFTYPTDIEVTPDETIWVADAYAHRIQMFGPDGTHQNTLGQKGTDKPGRFHVATGIDRGPDGNLHVADFKNNRVQVLQPGGKPVAVIEGDGEGDESMAHPTEVVATEEQLYVVDHGNHQIDIYERTGD